MEALARLYSRRFGCLFSVTAYVMLPVFCWNTADSVYHFLIQSVQPWLQANHEARKAHRLTEAFIMHVSYLMLNTDTGLHGS